MKKSSKDKMKGLRIVDVRNDIEEDYEAKVSRLLDRWEADWDKQNGVLDEFDDNMDVEWNNFTRH